jgi:hypothetical protein
MISVVSLAIFGNYLENNSEFSRFPGGGSPVG